jgi:hypothetical protein
MTANQANGLNGASVLNADAQWTAMMHAAMRRKIKLDKLLSL